MNSKPVIAWNNLLAAVPSPAITHSASETGYPFDNLGDFRDYTRWKSSETGELFVKLDAQGLPGGKVTVDTLAIAGHNLHSAGAAGLTLASSDDDASYENCFDPVTPTSDRVVFRRFGAQSRRCFKLTIPSGYTDAPEIGVLFIGLSLAFPTYPDRGFDPHGQEVETAAESSRTGRVLGVAESYRRRRVRAAFSRLSPEFVEQQWMPFFDNHGRLPFFFAWDPEGRPEEAYLMRLAELALAAPYEGPFRSLEISMVGTVEP